MENKSIDTICLEIVDNIKKCFDNNNNNNNNKIIYLKTKNFIDYKKDELINCYEYNKLKNNMKNFHFYIQKNEILKRDKIAITYNIFNDNNIIIHL